MSRTLIALLVAPLIVPILLLPYLRDLFPTNFWLAFGLVVSVVVAYIGVVVLGVPAFLLLRARGWTSFWVAPGLGFVVGAVMWLVFNAAFALALDQGVAGMRLSLSYPNTWKGILWPGGIAGTAVGIAFWLIARPSR